MNDNPYLAIEHGGPGTIGWRVHHYAEVGSTQEVAEQLALDGAAHGTVVIAESQSAGHGRLGREWFSPPGVNLHATVVLRPLMAVKEVPVMGLVAGVAMAEAVETVAPGLPGLKWPNDLWLRGKKAGGIIAQLLSGAPPCVLLGMGLNLNLRPEQVPRGTARNRDLGTDRNRPSMRSGKVRCHLVRPPDGAAGAIAGAGLCADCTAVGALFDPDRQADYGV